MGRRQKCENKGRVNSEGNLLSTREELQNSNRATFRHYNTFRRV